jgi:MFS family permease
MTGVAEAAPARTPERGTSDGHPTSLIVGVLSICGVVVALQQTMVIPLLPDFPAILGANRSDVGWLVTSTLLTGAVSTPIASRLADMFGKRRMILLCLLAMVGGCALSALGTGLIAVVAGRAVQGLAVAQIPIGISVMRDELPREKVPGAVALMSATLGIGSAIGLPLSGVIYEHAGWRAVFWTSSAAGAVLALLVLAFVPESTIRTRGRFDYAGATLLSAALTCLLLGINKGTSWGWTSEPTLLLFTTSGVLFIVWVPLELRVSRPLVDLRTSSVRPVLITNIAALFIGFSMYANMLATTQQLQMPTAAGYGFGVSVLTAGLCMLPSGLAMVALAPVSAAITRRHGAHVTLMLGGLMLASGYILRAFLTAAIWELVLGALIASMGTGLAFAAMPTLIMRSVPITETASANGLNTLMRAIGTSLCSATVIAVLASDQVSVGTLVVPSINAFKSVFWLAAFAGLLATGLAATLRGTSDRTPTRGGTAEFIVSGTVLEPDGTPIRQAVVTVLTLDGDPADWSRADNDGGYSIVLPGPGEYVVVCVADGWSPRSNVVTFRAADGKKDIPLLERLTMSGLVVHGSTVLDGGLVTVTRPSGEAIAACRTDARGRYSIPLPPTGRFILTVVTPDRRTAVSRQVLILATHSHTMEVIDIDDTSQHAPVLSH